MSLQKALLILVVSVLLAGLLPAGILMDRRLETALIERAKADLAVAPRILDDRLEMKGDAQMMHALDAAGTEGLGEALAAGDTADAARLVRDRVGGEGERPLLVTADHETLVGPPVSVDLLREAREGGLPVAIAGSGEEMRSVAVAAVTVDDRVVGFVGVWIPLDRAEAGILAGLTRSDVLLTDGQGRLAAFTGDSSRARALASLRTEGGVTAPTSAETAVREVEWSGQSFLLASSLWGPARVTFVRSLGEELAVLPELRRLAAVSFALALVFAAVVGGVAASLLGRPVRALASAADRVSEGDFYAPVPDSSVKEVRRVAEAFRVMREALARRFGELEEANRELENRQNRMSALQAELIQRDRLAAAGRLVGQLAHEIRNPVANVRNCLEILRRRATDEKSREFVDLAIDELLRMHDLAEQMLDLNRPSDASDSRCDAAVVVREIVTLVTLGDDDGEEEPDLVVRASGASNAPCRISAETLKQVLLNLVQNAEEAVGGRGEVELTVESGDDVVTIEVTDDGPGLAPEVIDRVFDPFFTTKASMHGVGLGLFIAEAAVRRAGGRLSAHNRTDEQGAVFRVELPAASPADGSEDAKAGSEPGTAVGVEEEA